MAQKQTRKVKLQSKHRELSHASKIVPELRINGIWLEQAGFKAGATVQIITGTNELIIKPL
jgi:toxic protein SymE